MRRAGQYSQTTFEILIVIGIVIVLNVLGYFYYARADLTEDRQFTLAPSSKEIVANLPDRVHIKAYVSSELPPALQQHEQRLRDLLDEYRASASTHLLVQFIDPENLDSDERQAIELRGITELSYQITESDQLSMGKAFIGMEINYMGGYEVIPSVPNASNLEYEITSSILKLITEDMPTIGFLTGHGEKASQNYSVLTEALRELYSVQDVDLSNGRKVPDNVDTLIIAEATQPFTERHHYCVDQFLMRGGKLVVMADGIKIDEMSGQAQYEANPLESLLTEYGVKITNDLAVDLAYCWQVPAGSMGGMRVMVPYPLFPEIVPTGFDPDSAATRGLQRLIFPYVSSLELLYDKISDDADIIELARTSERSYSYIPPVDLTPPPNQKFVPPGGESDLGKQTVAVQINGAFTSAFADDPIPAFDLNPDDPEGTIPEIDTEGKVTQSPQTSFVVIGNSTFVDDQAIQLPGNGIFFLNLMESLNLGEQLIDIRTRVVKNRPLDPELSEAEKNGLKFWGYGAIPILVTLYGVGRFYLKNQRKRLLQAMQSKSKGSGA